MLPTDRFWGGAGGEDGGAMERQEKMAVPESPT